MSACKLSTSFLQETMSFVQLTQSLSRRGPTLCFSAFTLDTYCCKKRVLHVILPKRTRRNLSRLPCAQGIVQLYLSLLNWRLRSLVARACRAKKKIRSDMKLLFEKKSKRQRGASKKLDTVSFGLCRKLGKLDAQGLVLNDVLLA